MGRTMFAGSKEQVLKRTVGELSWFVFLRLLEEDEIVIKQLQDCIFLEFSSDINSQILGLQKLILMIYVEKGRVGFGLDSKNIKGEVISQIRGAPKEVVAGWMGRCNASVKKVVEKIFDAIQSEKEGSENVG